MQHSLFSVLHPEVRRVIDGERAYQLWKWKSFHTHTIGEWAAILSCLGDKARYEYTHRHGVHPALAEIVQVTTTGLVALNQWPAWVGELLKWSETTGVPRPHQLHAVRADYYSEALSRPAGGPLPAISDDGSLLVKLIDAKKLADAANLVRQAFTRNADAARMMFKPDTDQTAAEAASAALAAVGEVQILLGDALSALKEVGK